MLAAAFLLLALLCLPLGAAQSCEAHQPDLLPACAFVYEQAGDEVFVPAGETQASMLATSGIAGSIGLLAQASASCSAAALALLCPQVWSHCLPISAGTAAPTNRSLCRNVCEEVFTACAPEIKALGQLVASLLPDCAATDAAGQALYPLDTYTVTVDGNTTLATCWSSQGGAPNETNVTCPEPLVRRREGCLLPCPSNLITHTRFRALKIVLSIFSVFNFIGWLALFASQAVRHGWRCLRWPQSVPVMVGIHGILLVISYWIGMMGGFEPVWCDGVNNATQGRASCAAQGFFFVWGLYGSIWWMFWMALNLSLSLIAPYVPDFHGYSVLDRSHIAYIYIYIYISLIAC